MADAFAATVEECADLSDDNSDTQQVAAGEVEGADENEDITEREIWRKLDRNQYK